MDFRRGDKDVDLRSERLGTPGVDLRSPNITIQFKVNFSQQLFSM
ncbi:MAG: hypothetical protein ACRD6X_01260 [Pyrinomonadaceae bacterium]